MSKTWHPDRWDVALSFKRGERDDWRKEYDKEAGESEVSEIAKVFVIINEWDTANGLTSSEVVDYNWYPSESAAWDDLLIIAESCGIGLDVDDTSFTTEDEEYRIEELNRA